MNPIPAFSISSAVGQDRHVDRLVVAVLEVGAGAAVGGEARGPGRDEDVASRRRPRCSRRRAAARRRRSRAARSRPASSPCRGCGRPPRCGASARRARSPPRRRRSTPSPSGSATWRLTSARARSGSSLMSPPRKYSGLTRPRTTLRSVTETVSSPPSGQLTPIREPAESGPSSGRLEFGLTRTNEPVPAPIESILTSGMLSMKRAMSGVGVISKRPSVISAMSNEVPPMSVQSTFAQPHPLGQRLAADDAADRPRDERRRQLLAPRSRSSRRARPSPAARSRRPRALVSSRTFCIVPREGSAA